MKAIIIAAGMGLRLGPLNDKPKCLLELKGKTLLQHQIDALRAVGIDKIILIKGYKKEMINYSELFYYINDNYQNNNILHSLFCAEKEMDDGFIAAYSDILYDAKIVKRLLDCKEDISIVVDVDWEEYYVGRTDHPIGEAENVIFDANNDVVKIGKILSDKKKASGEFIGMMKCSKRGADIFKKYFSRLKQIYTDKPFQKAPVFEKAYLTDIFQDMVDYGIKIRCVIIEKGWLEIDTLQDFKRVREILKNESKNFRVKESQAQRR